MDFSGLRIGPQVLTDGVPQTWARGNKEAAEIGANLGGVYEEGNVRGQIFSLTLPLTTGNVVAAGNLVGAAAAATTQFALGNPANSGKNLVLLEFAVSFNVATTAQMPAGPIFHGYLPAPVFTAAPVGTILSNVMGSGIASVARPFASAGGATLTGSSAAVTHKLTNFATTNTTQASPFLVNTIEYLDGKLVVPQGATWVPLFQAAGSVNFAYGVSITWREALA